MPGDNKYMNAYVKAKYHRRRREAIAKLGGKCFECGSIDDLEFDHIDPKQKSFPIGEALSGWSQRRINKELKKCQLLCKNCHDRKHHTAKYSHGTLSSYRYCRCDECRAAKAAWSREYNRRKKLAKSMKTSAGSS